MLIREDWEPTELKHLSRWRKRKQYAISLVTASETDVEQTESRLVICVEMWCVDFYFCTFSDKLNSIWNFRTVEGDSPVDMFCLKYFVIVLE